MGGQPTASAAAKTTLSIEGMHCASCVANVEQAVRRLPGVAAVSVNLATEQATIDFDPGRLTPVRLAQVITDSGYQARVKEPGQALAQRSSGDPVAQWRARAAFGVTLALPVAILGMWWPGRESGIVQAVLTTTLELGLGIPFVRSAIRSARHRRADMDSLIALGTTAAFAYSLWTLFSGHQHFYFDTAATILALVAVGKWLEAGARSAASGAVTRLLNLAAPTARIESAGAEKELPASELHPGDIVILKPGARVPADAVIISGESSFDESLLTGEPMPMARQVGEAIVGGSINLSGAVRARITRTGSQSTVGQIASLVESSLAVKTNAQRLADRIAGVFVPAVCAIAIITIIVWTLLGQWPTGVHAAIAVLIVACPCALGLATPAAVMVGCAVGTRRGILIRTPEVLERMGRLDTVVLDKTGTLSLGKPALIRAIPLGPSLTERDLLFLSGSVEKLSEHPLARAVLDAANHRGIRLEDPINFASESGGGVRGIVDGRMISVRRLDPSQAPSETSELAKEGMTISGVFEGQSRSLIGLLAFSDELRPGARDAVATLELMGLRVIMLTGDNAAAADRIASQVGIKEVVAGVLPADKHQKIRELKAQGHTVAMVGDGINDAAALSEADVGIAMGTGADIAKEAGDVVLVSGDPAQVPRAIRLSLAMRRRIRLGLLWAFAYNTILIPLAAFGLLHPMLAAAAMMISSAAVIGNALLLRRFDR